MPRWVAAGAMVSVAVCGLAAQASVLAMLGTTEREAHTGVFMTLVTGVVSQTGDAAAFQAASPEQRAVMVRAIATLAREFAGSADFTRRYAVFRDAQKPRPPTDARTGDEALTQQQAAIELAIKQALDAAPQMSTEARREFDANVAEMRRQVAEINADPAYRSSIDAAATAAAAEADADFAHTLALWASEYPEQSQALIARRLRQFLRACDAVDFDAQTERRPDGRRYFVNPAYEQRSREWKRCYRAGRPAVEAARAAADEWLTALKDFQ